MSRAAPKPVQKVLPFLNPTTAITEKATGMAVDRVAEPGSTLGVLAGDKSAELPDMSGASPEAVKAVAASVSAAAPGVTGAATVKSSDPASTAKPDDSAEQKRVAGRAATLLTGASGLVDVPYTARKKLLGA